MALPEGKRRTRIRGISGGAFSLSLSLLLAMTMLLRPTRAFIPLLAPPSARPASLLRTAAAASSSNNNNNNNEGAAGTGGGGGGGGEASRLKRIVRRSSSSSFSFNKAPGASSSRKPSGGGENDGKSQPPPPPPRQPRPPPPSSLPPPPQARKEKAYRPISEEPGQHLTPKGVGPRESYDIDARPNSRKARKAASSYSPSSDGGGGGGGGEGGGDVDVGGWRRPSRVQQRRTKKENAMMDEKLRRLKVQRFGKEDLLGSKNEDEDDDNDLRDTHTHIHNSRKSTTKQDLLQCTHFGSCSGCFFRAGFTETPLMEDARIFFRTQARYDNFSINLASDIHGWRTQAKLAIAPVSKWGGCKLGLYEEGTHRVLPIPDCRVHHPSINRAVEVIAAATEKVKTRAFDQSSLEGSLRYVQCAVERRTGKVQLTLVWNTSGKKEAGAELSRLVKALKANDFLLPPSPKKSSSENEGEEESKEKERGESNKLWHSIWVNFRTGPGNAIFSHAPRSWQKLHGLDYLTEKIGPSQVVFYLTPQLFRQGNLDGFGKLVAKAQTFVPSQSVVCELYGGVGVLGLNMLGKASEVRFSDINPFLGESVEKTVAALPDKRREKVSFSVATALEGMENGQAQGADLLIVDPPRKGLEPEVLAHLQDKRDEFAGSIKRLIYVSCGFDALKRDAMALLGPGGGGWKLVHAEGFVLFPGSDHLETLAIFDRK